MKRFKLIFIFMIFFLLTGLAGCTSVHTCKFNKKNTGTEYLCSSATCQLAESYWYSCECGNKSTTRKFYKGFALAHNYVGTTCISDGTCSSCLQKQNAFGHTYTAATCTKPETCLRCSATSGDALGHNYEPDFEWSSDFTQCTAKLVCERNNEHILEETESTIYVKESNATCLAAEKGHYIANFSFSGFENIEALSTTITKEKSLGHSFTNYIMNNNATCTKDGTKTATCDRCSAKDTKTVEGSKLGHRYTEIIIEPTCTKQGYTRYTCKCGHSYSDDYVKPFGHSFGDYVLDNNASCTQDGTKTAVCDRCSEKDVVVITGTKLGHSFGDYILDNNASCTQDGTKTAVCDRCSEKDVVLITGTKLEHKYTRRRTTSTYISEEATCTKKAKYYFSCACGKKGTDTFEYGSFLEHTYVYNSKDKTQHNTECKNCGKKLSEQHIFINNECVCGYIKGLNFTLNSDCISYSVSSSDLTVTDIYIPNTYNNLPVTSINKLAFSLCKSTLTSVTIGNNVTSIEEGTFKNCSSLTSVTIGNSVSNIGYNAFEGCHSLISVNYLGTIDSWASIEFNDYYANPIYYANNLNINEENVLVGHITINGNKVSSYAFMGCSSLTSATIGNRVTSIGTSAFMGCSSLTSIEIPNSVTSIGGSAFAYCSSLTSIEIPNSVTSIGGSAFYYCSSLTSIEIPNNVTSIGGSAFYSCDNLTKVNYTGTIDNWASIEFANSSANPLSNEANLYINDILQANAIINSKNINNYAFENCSSLLSITIGNNVTSIGKYAFTGCTTQILWGNNPNITEIGSYTFYNYKGTSITIPNSVTSIEKFAFTGCTSLTSVTIGDSVKSIGEWAFESCYKLTKVNYLGTINTWVQIKFSDYYSTPLNDEADLYINNVLQTNITINVEEINDYALLNCVSLTSVTIGDSVKNVGKSTFSGCSTLTSVIIGNSVKSIGEYAFSGCSSLTSVSISNSVTFIEQFSFAYCENLKSVTFGSNSRLYAIEYAAFYECSSLASIVIPKTVTSIENKVFYGCDNLKSVTFERASLWFVSPYEGGRDNVILVDDPSRNSLQITINYCDYYWHSA